MSLIIEALSKAKNSRDEFDAETFSGKPARPALSKSFLRNAGIGCLGLAVLLISMSFLKNGMIFREAVSQPVSQNALQGIYFDNAQPLCLLEGKIYREGHSWKGMSISKITQDGVLLKDWKGQSFTLEWKK